MSAVIVTAHAAERYIERVAPSLTLFEAMTAIHHHDAAIILAAGFGCNLVRLGDGTRLVINGPQVITVLSRAWRHRPPPYHAMEWAA